LNLLEDEDKEIRGYALNHLLTIVPQFWAEISEKISWLYAKHVLDLKPS
jgi:26S proteasome regulatory subunit N2